MAVWTMHVQIGSRALLLKALACARRDAATCAAVAFVAHALRFNIVLRR